MTHRFLIGQLSHETNAFSPIRTCLQHFQQRGFLEGPALLEHFTGTHTTLGGFIHAALLQEDELIPSLSASAVPSGLVARDTFAILMQRLEDHLDGASGFDAIFLVLHGAMVAEKIPDAEGYLLERLRRRVGADMPIICTLDYHANVTDRMVENADLLLGLNTYPHVDGWERGAEAHHLAKAILSGAITPANFLVRPPLAPGVVPARTSWGPMEQLMNQALAYEMEPGVINVSAFGGFVYSDIFEAGLSFLATVDRNRERARTIAQKLGREAWRIRHEFQADLKPPRDAVQAALKHPGHPVILADVADNTGGGASGDGTALLAALLEEGARNAAIVTIPDPKAVVEAFAIGVGGTYAGYVGGKIDDQHGPPVWIKGPVRLLSDGRFVYRGPMSTGLTASMGRTAVIETNGIAIIVNEDRFQPVDPEVARSVGIEPLEKKIVVVKSAVHYRASYEPIASKIIEVDGPGLSSPNLERFSFRNLRRPIFPLDCDDFEGRWQDDDG